MKKISLKNRQKEIIDYALIDDEDFEWLNQWTWYKNHDGYAVRRENDKTIYMHVEIFKHHNLWEKEKLTDHIDLIALNNQKKI